MVLFSRRSVLIACMLVMLSGSGCSKAPAQNGSSSGNKPQGETTAPAKEQTKVSYVIKPNGDTGQWIIGSVKNTSDQVLTDVTVSLKFTDGEGQQAAQGIEVEPSVLAPGKTGFLQVAANGTPSAVEIEPTYKIDPGEYYADWVVTDDGWRGGERSFTATLKNTGTKTMIAPSLFVVALDKDGNAIGVCAGMFAKSEIAPGESAESELNVIAPEPFDYGSHEYSVKCSTD